MTTSDGATVRPAATHVLKCWPDSFRAIASGRKRFEVRRDDRGGFAVGDLLHLDEWDPAMGRYTGDVVLCRVDYVLDRHALPLADAVGEGYAVLSITAVRVVDA